MQVENFKQTPSGPFWMGCERSMRKEYDQVRKAPFTGIQSDSGSSSSNYNIINSNTSAMMIGMTIILIRALIT